MLECSKWHISLDEKDKEIVFSLNPDNLRSFSFNELSEIDLEKKLFQALILLSPSEGDFLYFSDYELFQKFRNYMMDRYKTCFYENLDDFMHKNGFQSVFYVSRGKLKKLKFAYCSPVKIISRSCIEKKAVALDAIATPMTISKSSSKAPGSFRHLRTECGRILQFLAFFILSLVSIGCFISFFDLKNQRSDLSRMNSAWPLCWIHLENLRGNLSLILSEHSLNLLMNAFECHDGKYALTLALLLPYQKEEVEELGSKKSMIGQVGKYDESLGKEVVNAIAKGLFGETQKDQRIFYLIKEEDPKEVPQGNNDVQNLQSNQINPSNRQQEQQQKNKLVEQLRHFPVSLIVLPSYEQVSEPDRFAFLVSAMDDTWPMLGDDAHHVSTSDAIFLLYSKPISRDSTLEESVFYEQSQPPSNFMSTPIESFGESLDSRIIQDERMDKNFIEDNSIGNKYQMNIVSQWKQAMQRRKWPSRILHRIRHVITIAPTPSKEMVSRKTQLSNHLLS